MNGIFHNRPPKEKYSILNSKQYSAKENTYLTKQNELKRKEKEKRFRTKESGRRVEKRKSFGS